MRYKKHVFNISDICSFCQSPITGAIRERHKVWIEIKKIGKSTVLSKHLLGIL